MKTETLQRAKELESKIKRVKEIVEKSGKKLDYITVSTDKSNLRFRYKIPEEKESEFNNLYHSETIHSKNFVMASFYKDVIAIYNRELELLEAEFEFLSDEDFPKKSPIKE